MRDEHGVHNIRIDKGKPGHEFLSQQTDHVVVSYNGRIIDNTGKNYILKDDSTGSVYKVPREKADRGMTGIEHALEIDTSLSKPNKHPDAHIPANLWHSWKSFHKPE